MRIAALLFLADAGFGIAMPIALAHLARTGELPLSPWGFRAFSGPFEQLGRDAFTVLGWALVAVCALDVLAGVWLWLGKRRGASLGLGTTPFALALGIGFALPFLLLLAPIRAGLVLSGRRNLQ
ncbi:MAG TPA: hypothetical protein VGQ58_05050 [Candidatus Limnocylindrales bacterium]|nr:hypothetical protein [Candidatus Limnocylindrales bacterium]